VANWKILLKTLKTTDFQKTLFLDNQLINTLLTGVSTPCINRDVANVGGGV
jgi:hypothetical protein